MSIRDTDTCNSVGIQGCNSVGHLQQCWDSRLEDITRTGLMSRTLEIGHFCMDVMHSLYYASCMDQRQEWYIWPRSRFICRGTPVCSGEIAHADCWWWRRTGGWGNHRSCKMMLPIGMTWAVLWWTEHWGRCYITTLALLYSTLLRMELPWLFNRCWTDSHSLGRTLRVGAEPTNRLWRQCP